MSDISRTPGERLRIMRSALRLIAGASCSNFTTGPGSCVRAGRQRGAKYSADAWCDACVAYDALKKAGRKHG